MELIQDDSLQNFEKLKTSADFCLECGDLLNLPIYSDKLECSKCGFKINLLDYPFEEIVTSKVFTEKKPWLIKFNERKRGTYLGKEDEVQDKLNRPIINHDCPECSHDKAYYSTMQRRSADEGQTVIYECIKCRHTVSVDS